MSIRNRHLQYRKSIYKKRRLRATVIIAISVIVITFALFMIIGTILHEKTQSDNSALDESIETSKGKNEVVLEEAPFVNAYALSLLRDGSLFSERLADIDSNATSVCINLNRDDGTLLYKSNIANEFSNIDIDPDASSLGNSISQINRKDFYTSAILYVPSFENEDDLKKEVETAIWSAIACEALREGIGDVLIIAPDATPDDIDLITHIADTAHKNVSESIIGFALPDSFVTDEDSISYIEKLRTHFNYLTVDMATSEDKQDIEYIKDLGLQSMIIRHEMRILLPYASDEKIQNTYIETINKSNFMNWQILPPQ